MSRREQALQRIDLKGRGLELGPLYNPLVTKDEGDIKYLDHMSYEDLKKKYGQDPGVPLEQIVPTDYVLQGSLQQTLKGKKFDYVIACHVIEHIPDTVRWLQDVASVLKPGGILSLVIPDKRYTFDLHRNESRPADVMGAYLDKHTRFTSTAMYDDTYEYRHGIESTQIWSNSAAYSHQPAHNQIGSQKAAQRCQDNLDPKKYVDCHCYVLTPYSFFRIIRSLIQHGLFDYEVAYFGDTPHNEHEFYVSLRKVEASKERQLASIPDLPAPRDPRELEAEVQGLRNQLEQLTTSRSWRITKPLRALTALLGR